MSSRNYFLCRLVVVPVLSLIPGCAASGPGEASGPLSLQSAFGAMKSAEAIHIKNELDKGKGTPVTQSWDCWSASGLGYRSDLPGHTEIYDEKSRRMYRGGPEGGAVVERYETSIGTELLRRGRQEESIEYLIARQRCGDANVRHERIEANGKLIHRISCSDDASRPLVVEFDPAEMRILKTESWTRRDKTTGEEPTRVVTTYEYPSLAQLDPKLFEIPDGNQRAGVHVVPSDQAALEQCLTNLRDIAGQMMKYEEHHPEGLPADLEKAIRSEEGFRESMLHCPLIPTNGRLQYESKLKPGTKSFAEMPFDSVVFECRNHGGRVAQVYGGGHAMVKVAK
ncbi:MAG TPA: hypothetical protein VJZ71_05410 [Phycisphaerae bacterium]|nr:hypothetical protein [Phycisphaerae bacterium]